MNYSYQLVSFIDVNPEAGIGTPIYDGPAGWIPNVALKRRFCLRDISETDLIDLLDDFFSTKAHFFGITFTEVIQPDDMPVTVLEVEKLLA